MDNIFKEVGHGVEAVGKDIAHVIVEAVEYPAKAAKVMATVTKNYPSLKPTLTTVVTSGAKIGADLVGVIAAKGVSWTDDIALVADVEAFFKFITKTVTPEVEAIYGELNKDVA